MCEGINLSHSGAMSQTSPPPFEPRPPPHPLNPLNPSGQCFDWTQTCIRTCLPISDLCSNYKPANWLTFCYSRIQNTVYSSSLPGRPPAGDTFRMVTWTHLLFAHPYALSVYVSHIIYWAVYIFLIIFMHVFSSVLVSYIWFRIQFWICFRSIIYNSVFQ